MGGGPWLWGFLATPPQAPSILLAPLPSLQDTAPQLRTLTTAQPPALTSPARGRGAWGRPGSCECSLGSGCRPEERVVREVLGPQLTPGQALPPLAPPKKARPGGQVTGGQQVPRPKGGIQAPTFQLQPHGCPGFLADSTLSWCGLSRGPCRNPFPEGPARHPSPGFSQHPVPRAVQKHPQSPRVARGCGPRTWLQGLPRADSIPGAGPSSHVQQDTQLPAPGLCSSGSGQGDGTVVGRHHESAQAWHGHPRTPWGGAASPPPQEAVGRAVLPGRDPEPGPRDSGVAGQPHPTGDRTCPSRTRASSAVRGSSGHTSGWDAGQAPGARPTGQLETHHQHPVGERGHPEPLSSRGGPGPQQGLSPCRAGCAATWRPPRALQQGGPRTRGRKGWWPPDDRVPGPEAEPGPG